MNTSPFLAALLCPEATPALYAIARPEERHGLSSIATAVSRAGGLSGLAWQAELKFTTAAGEWYVSAFVPEPIEALLANLSGLHREGDSPQAAPALQVFFRELAQRAVRRWSWAGEKPRGKLLRVGLIDTSSLPAAPALKLDLTIRAGGLSFPGMFFLLPMAVAGALLGNALNLTLSEEAEILQMATDPGESLSRRDAESAIDAYALVNATGQFTVNCLLQAGLSIESLGLLWAGGTTEERNALLGGLSQRNRRELQQWLDRHRDVLARLGAKAAREEAQLKCRPLLARRGFGSWLGRDRFVAALAAWEALTAEAMLAASSPDEWAERFCTVREQAGNELVTQSDLLWALARLPDRVFDRIFAGISDAGKQCLRGERDANNNHPATALRCYRKVTEVVAYQLADETFQRQTRLALEPYLIALREPEAVQAAMRRPLPELAAALADYPLELNERIIAALGRRQGEELREELGRVRLFPARQRAQARHCLLGHIEELIGTGELLLARQRPWWWR